MKELLKKIRKNREGDVGRYVDRRLSEFGSYKDKPSRVWFSEMCFCLLTANSKAHTAMNIQKELGAKGFCEACADDVKACIIRNKHRFHNNKTRFIISAREHIDIKKKIQSIVREKGENGAREWLVLNVKGLGLKEASHFLRNVGYFNLSILDRHILRVMHEHGMISEIPKPISKKKYLEIEQKFLDLAKKMKMTAAELDFHMWYLRTGEVLK